MPDVKADVLSNAIMGKIYDVLTNGDDVAPASPDNFYSWETPGEPITAEAFRYVTQGFTGTITLDAVQKYLATEAAGQPAPAGGAAAPQAGLTDADRDKIRGLDTSVLFNQAENFARLVDFIPDVLSMSGKKMPTLAVQTDNGSLSDVYQLTLQMSQVMDSVVPDDEQKKIDHFRSLLTQTVSQTDIVTGDVTQVVKPSPLVQAYNDKMTAYDNAALAYNSARIDALAADNPRAVQTFAINGPILRNSVKAAMADWISAGYKVDYEKIAAYISQVEARDMSLIKAAYEDDLEKARITNPSSGSDFYYTGVAPADFANSNGWSTFHFDSGDFSRYQNSSFHSSGWSVSASAGFLGIGAHGGGGHDESKVTADSHFNSDHFAMRFEIAQVALLRPWFKTSFLNSKSWRFDPGKPDVDKEKLSDGKIPPNGLMPAYPTSMILIRNLHLDFGESNGMQSFMTQQSSSHQEGGVSFSFGPFSLGSSAGHHSADGKTSSSASFSFTDQGLDVPGMQIVGFRCHVLPASPVPDPSITKWI